MHDAPHTISTRGEGGDERVFPSKVPPIILLIMGIGIVIDSIYLTTVHYAKIPLYCPMNSFVNCAQVTTSQWSMIPGTTVPITIPGMFWGLVTVALSIATLRAHGARALTMRLPLAQLIWSGVGLVTVIYLIYAELVLVGKLCEWCTSVHIMVVITVFVALVQVQKVGNFLRAGTE